MIKKIPIRQLTAQAPLPTGQFKIRLVEDIVGGQHLFHHLHRHDFYFILAIKTGTGKHEIDFVPHNVQNNTVFFLRPGQVHQLELAAGSSGYLVEFSNEFYHPNSTAASLRFRKASTKNYCAVDNTRFNKLCHLLQLLFEEFTNKEDGYIDSIQSMLDLFFIEFVRQSNYPNNKNPVTGSYAQERLEEFLALLDKHIIAHKQVSDYTSFMNVSSYQLNEITKTTVGKTASEIITERIILEAKRNLLATTNQVKDIADLLGYEDTSYFIRFFRKHTNLSPEAFRNNFA